MVPAARVMRLPVQAVVVSAEERGVAVVGPSANDRRRGPHPRRNWVRVVEALLGVPASVCECPPHQAVAFTAVEHPELITSRCGEGGVRRHRAATLHERVLVPAIAIVCFPVQPVAFSAEEDSEAVPVPSGDDRRAARRVEQAAGQLSRGGVAVVEALLTVPALPVERAPREPVTLASIERPESIDRRRTRQRAACSPAPAGRLGEGGLEVPSPSSMARSCESCTIARSGAATMNANRRSRLPNRRRRTASGTTTPRAGRARRVPHIVVLRAPPAVPMLKMARRNRQLTPNVKSPSARRTSAFGAASTCGVTARSALLTKGESPFSETTAHRVASCSAPSRTRTSAAGCPGTPLATSYRRSVSPASAVANG